jgi:uncharacterized membrane protein
MKATPTIAARENVLHVSASFKQEAIKSIIAIIAFIGVYLLLFAVSLGLVALSFAGGVGVIASHPSFLTLLIGVG